MNKGISKWPSRALNLLVVLAMVISLSAILVAPSIAAQEWSPTCDPSPVYNGCQLEVAVATYIKVDGDFIPENEFEEYDCFYVNAVVVNTGNDTAEGPINATISFRDDDCTLSTGETYTKTWGNGDLINASPEGLLADFWWKVCCDGPLGDEVIMVNATSASTCDQLMPAQGCAHIYQGAISETNCPRVEIVEAPGMPDKQGVLGDYQMTMPNPVAPCQNFGIKAEITNTCLSPLTNVLVHISWTGQASIVGGDPLTWNIGDLAVGETKGVGWTLHCDDPGDVAVTVDLPDFTNELLVDDPWIVHQQGGYGIEVDITKPFCTIDACNPTCEIVQPTGDCGAEDFTVEANLINLGDSPVVLVYAIASVNPSSGWAQIVGSAIKGPYTILPGISNKVTVQYSMTCIGNGTGNVTVFASGADSVTGAPVTDDDLVNIRQTYITADPSPDPAYAVPAEVNKCQEFPVTFRYMNYSGNAWNDPSGGNITACIHWDRMTDTFTDSCGNTEIRTGNATLIDSVYYRRVVGGIPEAWILLTSSPTYTGNDTVGYTSCVHIPVVCDCCGTEIRWQFQCTEVGQVKFSSRIDVQQTTPVVFTDYAVSKNICVNQVWKAHLMADSFFFIQDDYGKMLMQEAVVPGTQFHVVIPVINTGDADAQSVQVYFTLTDAPKAPCTDSYEILTDLVYGPFGDATSITSLGGGAYVAYIPLVPGHSAKKVTLTLECLCEGNVYVWVPDAVAAWSGAKGVRGYDENTGSLVPQANIVVPPCPRALEQIPFTVVIENPNTCDTFNQGQTFPVKAKITNGASVDLLDVYATLSWRVNDNVELVQAQGAQTATKLVGNITAGSYTEITWELRCMGDSNDNGEVYLTVSATSTDPLLTAYSNTVNVHQVGIPNADIGVEILSPDEYQHGQDWDKSHKHAMIATGQQFAVTAKVYNNGDDPTDVTVCIGDCGDWCGYFDYVTLLSPDDTLDLGPMDPYEFQVVTWTFSGGADHNWAFDDCDPVETCLEVCAWGEMQDLNSSNDCDDVEVAIYPAAFLVTEIEPIANPSLGGLFTINYTITNIGVADATTVVPNLSVSPAGAAVIAQTPDYTPRTIAGWSWGEPYNDIEGSFTLRAMQQTPFTVTVGPTGDDECGWHALVGEECWGYEDDGWYEECEPQYNWVQFAFWPIQSRFLWPAYITLEPGVEGGPGGCPDLTTMDIELNAGWNLISLPLIPDDGDVATLFSGLPVTAIWEYSGGAWTVPDELVDGLGYWVYMTAAATLTVDGVVNPMPPQTPPTYDVAAGWNLIGFKSTCTRTAGAYLYGVPFVRIWGFADGWVSMDSGDMMQPGLGYWIAATGVGTIFP